MFLTPGSRATRYRLPLVRDGVGNWALRNGAVAQGLHLYKNFNSDVVGLPSSTGYMRNIFNWSGQPWVGGTVPTLTIGPRSSLTGALEAFLEFEAGPASPTEANTTFTYPGVLLGESDLGDQGDDVDFAGTTGHIRVWSGGSFSLNNDTPINRPSGPNFVPAGVAGILGIGDYTGSYNHASNQYTANGYYQWAGQARVTGDVSNSTTTLADATGLSINVKAGRTYSFEFDLSITAAAAGGIKVAISGTATATNIVYDGWILDGSAGGVVGNTQATALNTVVATSTITGTTAHVIVRGTITVNAAGTLKLQFAQNTSNATATVVKLGSYLIAQDMP